MPEDDVLQPIPPEVRGEIRGFNAIARDVTERVKAEEEVRSLA